MSAEFANSVLRKDSRPAVAQVIGDVRSKGVRLWSVNGELHYKAPKGALSSQEIEQLRRCRSEIVALLESSPGQNAAVPRRESVALEHRSGLQRAPATFTQLAHWRMYRLGERPAIRQLASAMRLRGELHLEALRAALAEVIRRHDVLRTRLVVHSGVLIQEIPDSSESTLDIVDLTSLPERERQGEVLRLIDDLILEPIDVARGPLFGIRLLRMGTQEHILILALEHTISDAFSMNILMRELFMAYGQAARGKAFDLPAVPIQFADFAVWQHESQRVWLEKHGDYWEQRLGNRERLRFPGSRVTATDALGWGTAALRIGRDLKGELREWCRLKGTTLVMGILTAYVWLVMRWCDVSDAVIQYITDGRTSDRVQNTIGYFASPLFLRIRFGETDTFADLLKQVTQEYCLAYEHADFSMMESQWPRPEFTRSSFFNWVPLGAEAALGGVDGLEGELRVEPVAFEHPMMRQLERDTEPAIVLYDTVEEILGGVYFPLNRFSSESLERFARNFHVGVNALVRRTGVRVRDVDLI